MHFNTGGFFKRANKKTGISFKYDWMKKQKNKKKNEELNFVVKSLIQILKSSNFKDKRQTRELSSTVYLA